MKNQYIITVLLSMLSFSSMGQKQFWELGFGAGVSTYWGDLNSDSFAENFMNMSLSGDIYLRYNRDHFGVRTMVSFGKLKGNDANTSNEVRRRRNLNFNSPLTELSVLGEYNLFDFDPSDNESIFTPFVAAGFAVFKFNPKTTYQEQEVYLQPLGTEGQGVPGYPAKYNLVSYAIPLGGGLKFKINKALSGSLEMIGRLTFTDYIDDVSTNYGFYEELLVHNGELSANLSQRIDEYLGEEEGSNASLTDGSKRGGSDVNDYYFSLMVNLSYNLGGNLSFGGKRRKKGASCPKF